MAASKVASDASLSNGSINISLIETHVASYAVNFSSGGSKDASSTVLRARKADVGLVEIISREAGDASNSIGTDCTSNRAFIAGLVS